MQFLIILKTVISILPSLIAVIATLESAVPQGGKGQQKLEALKGIMQSIHNMSDDASVPFEKLWGALAPITGILVQLQKLAVGES